MDRLVVKTVGPHGKKSAPYAIAVEVGVAHPIIYRQAGNLGPFNRMESTGRRDSKRFDIAIRKGTSALGYDTSRSRDHGYSEATAASVKKAVRRLRDQEAEKLDAIDGEIAELEQQIAALRTRRVEVVREAWTKGNVVRLAELEQMADEYEKWLEEQAERRRTQRECEECGGIVDGAGRCETCGAVQ